MLNEWMNVQAQWLLSIFILNGRLNFYFDNQCENNLSLWNAKLINFHLFISFRASIFILTFLLVNVVVLCADYRRIHAYVTSTKMWTFIFRNLMMWKKIFFVHGTREYFSFSEHFYFRRALSHFVWLLNDKFLHFWYKEVVHKWC